MKKLLLFIFITSSLTVFSKNWYLNDGSRVGDVYCTAVGGANGGTGLTPDSPKLFATGTTTTLKTLIASAAFSPGDVIFIDAMDVQMGSAPSGSEISFNKALTIIGAGVTKTILRGNSSALSPASFGYITSSNVVFKNFQCTNWAKSSSGSASCIEIVANSADLTGILFDGFWMDKNIGSGGDGACKIYGTYKISATIKNILSTCNDNASYGGGFWIEGNGHKITFSNCYLYNNKRNTNGGAINIFGTNSSDGITTLVNIDKCSFSNNGSINYVTSANGGAISITGAKLIVTNCCFSNNIIGNTGQYGNAICGLKNSRISISNSTFSSNTGAKGQVASYNFSDPSIIAGSYELIIDNCIFDNSASSSAKCIYYKPTSGTFSVNNCTFTSSGAATQIYSGVAWSLTNSAITAGTNPVLGGTAPSTINTILPTSTPTPTPTCNGAISGDCSATIRTIDCTSDNLPPIIKGHDSIYVTNNTCTFTVPSYAAIDLCDPSPTVTSVPSAGTALASGTTTSVIITSTDATGNSSSITVYLTTPVCTPCVTLTSAAGTDNQSLCRNTSLTNITYSTKSDITGISNSGVAGANGLPPGVSATYNAGVITISGIPTNDAMYNYSIPLVGGTCNGQTVTGIITVNSLDNASFTYPTSSFCSILDSNPTPTITGLVGGTFTSSPTGLSINPSTGSVNMASSSAGTYEIKYTTNGQCPNVSTFPISIGFNPAVNAVTNQTVCQGANFNAINFTGSPGTVYQWTNSNTAIGLSASGTGDIASFTAKGTTYGGSTANASILVTPIIGNCKGSSKSFILTVNPLDNPAFAYDDNSFCTIQADPIPLIKGTLGGYFTFTPKGLVMDTASGKINLAVTTANNYLITYHTVGICKQDSTVGIGIGNNPSLDDIDDQDMCEGASFDPVVFKGNPGTVFSWTNSNTTIGIPINGTTNIPAFIASGVVNFRDTIAQMVVSSRIGKCIGNSVSFKYKVHAKPNIQGRIEQIPETINYQKDTTVCNVTSIKLTATGINRNSDYHWTPITGLLGFPSSGPNVTTNLDSTQQFVVSGINQFGCSNSDSVIVRVLNPKITNILNDKTVCVGSSFNAINFTGTPRTVYQWTNSNPAIGIPATGTGDISSFIGATTGTATITVTPRIGSCVGVTKNFNLNVNSPIIPAFSQLGPYCKDVMVPPLPTTSNNSISGTWSPALDNTVTTTYTFTPYAGQCATSTTTMTVTVNSPTTPTFAQVPVVCSGATITLPSSSTNTPAIQGTWSPAINNTATTTYTFTPDAGQCTTPAIMTVTVNSPTTPTFTQIPAICSGATITLPTNSTNTPAIPGTWLPAINNTATTTYTFTPTVGQCANTVTISITVNTSTSASPISGNTDICQGSTSQLTNATPGGVWSSSNTAIATVNTSGLVTAISEGVSTIKYDVTGNSSCSQSAEKPFRVIGLPVVNSVPDQQVCEGASFNPINFSGTAGATFNWSNSDTKIGLNANGSGNINAFIAKGTTLGGSAFTSYITVTPVIGNCIGNINILKLSVSPQENPSFSYNDDLFCKNQSDPIPTILGKKGGSFTAISSGLVVNSTSGVINLNASIPGNNHSVMYKTGGVCSKTSTASFVILSLPVVDSIPNYTICSGKFADSIKFKGTAGASFDWTNSNTTTGVLANGQNIIYPFDAINNGNLDVISQITVTPRLGKCFGPTKKFNISVRFVPRLIISQLDTSVCSGGTLNFKTELTPSSSNSIHQWFVNDLKVSGDSAYYSSNSLKNYDKLTVNVSGKDFCPTTSILFVRVNSLSLSMQLPSMLYVKAPAVNLVGYPNGGTFIGKGIVNNKLDPNIGGVGSKLVTYSFKNAKNCVGQITEKIIIYDTVPNNCHSITYDTITVTNNVTKYDTVKVSDTVSILKVKFKLTTGIKANQETTMRVYPNPTSDILRIEVADEKAMAGYTYKIIDAAGKVVYNQLVKAAVTEIPLKTLGAVGAYFLEVLDENFKIVVSKKIILE